MKLEEFKKYCLSKKGVTEEYPFGEGTIVLKVGGKIFAITSYSVPLSINLKCDPEKAAELRERYDEVQPGYHMNKKHWNTIDCSGRLSDKEIFSLTDHSYELIVKGLSMKQRDELEQEN